MNICAYGGGTNSTALLVECVKRDIPVDLILFADTGAERPHTYAYVETFSKWLVDHGYPAIVTVKAVKRDQTINDIISNCLDNKMLPSLAYGLKKCSHKFKIAPQEKYVNNWKPAQAEWKAGRKLTKLIGYDADEPYRADRVSAIEDAKYDYQYPLIEWDMGRDECIESIKSVGLCLPGKSACYICPSSKPSEIRQLKKVYPELADKALEIEANADLTSIKGLGRNFAWADLLAQDELFSDDYTSTPELTCGCYDG